MTALVAIACAPALLAVAYAIARVLAPVATARLVARRLPVVTTRVALPPPRMRARRCPEYREAAMERGDVLLPQLPERVLIGRALVMREGPGSFVIAAPATFAVERREERGRLVPRAVMRGPAVLARMDAIVVGDHAELRSRLAPQIEPLLVACLATTLGAVAATAAGREGWRALAVGAAIVAVSVPLVWRSARGARGLEEARLRELHQQLADELRARAALDESA